MSLSYGGYATRIDRICATRPFQTEYSARFCGSTGPVLYNQVPKYVWQEPRRPLNTSKTKDLYQPTHLRSSPFAAMTSYEPPKDKSFPALATGEKERSREIPMKENQTARSSSTVDRSCPTKEDSKFFCSRPSSLLSKYPKNVHYVRDTCFFYPVRPGKQHYYVVNPRWFSEKDVTIRKNNVFA